MTRSNPNSTRRTAARKVASATGRADALTSPPNCPPGLSNAEKLTWKRLAAAAVSAGTLARGDLDALLLATRAVTRAQRLAAEAANAPATTTGAAGQLVSHPIHRAVSESTKLSLTTLAGLGLTPMARAQLDPLPASLPTDPEARKDEQMARRLIDGPGLGSTTAKAQATTAEN